MSDKMRWHYGDTNPVMPAIDSATVIEIGDLIWQDVDNAKAANTCKNRKLFVENFLGVAMQRSRAGDTDPIRVATTGVFEFDCPSSTFELGQHVGPDQAWCEEVPDGLLNQQIVLVSDSNQAVARVAKRASGVATSVLIDICSTVMSGGINGTTA